MIRSILSLFRSRDRAEPPPTDRHIFRYWAGEADRWRFGDPVVIGRALEAACPDYADHLATIAAPAKLPPGPLLDELKAKRAAATSSLVSACRKAFGVEPLTDGGGLTEAETLGVLADYLRFMAAAAEAAGPH